MSAHYIDSGGMKMTEKIKVSVIVPVFNAETYLASCLDSILTQQYEKLEIICIDDASTDGSLRILSSSKRKK